MTTFIIIGIAVLILIAIIFKSEDEPDHAYHAEFGSTGDHLSFWNKGFAIGSKAFTKKVSHTNFFLAGPTGSGKSSIVTIACAKSLARGNSSMIFNDVSGELWQHTSAYLKAKGYNVLRINFADANHSESFNPLLDCKTISDIQKLAQIIMQNTTGESKADPFWENSSIMLLSLFCRYLVFYTEPEYRTLQNVLHLIEKFATDGKAVNKLFIKTDENLFSLYKSTLVLGEKTLQSVIATARTALNLFNDPEVCKSTATNSICVGDLRKEKTAIYVCNPLKDLKYFKPLSALFFQHLFNFVLSEIPSGKDRSVFFIIDEFSSMKFPDMAVTICNVRKYKAGLLLAMQDSMTLAARYGEAEAHLIKTNCGIQVFLPNQPLHTCTELSKLLGRYTYEDNKRQHVRELLTPDEIRMCNDALVLVHNNPPLRFAATPYYKSLWLSHLSKAKALELPVKAIGSQTLIQFS